MIYTYIHISFINNDFDIFLVKYIALIKELYLDLIGLAS